MAETFRVAVIGRTGHGDYGHDLDVVWLKIPRAKVVAVADDDERGRTAALKRLGIDRGYADWRKMLDEIKPDVVSIAPRWIDQHHDMAVAAADRGIHIFIEKPLCRTLAEADEIVAACERTHTKLVIAHTARYSPLVEQVRRLIAEGKIGRVLEFRGRGKEDQRGGAEDLWVLGTHILDLMNFFAGKPDWCFATMRQEGRAIRKSDVRAGNEGLGPLAGDNISACYGMPDGTLAYFASVRNAGMGARFALQIFGTLGVFEITIGRAPQAKFLADPSWSAARSNKHWQDISTAGIDKPEPADTPPPNDGMLAAAMDLLSSIEQNREPKGSMYQARTALEMTMAVFESQRLGSRVTLPLKNRQNPLAMLS